MTDFRPIELGDRYHFSEILAREQPVVSELTFANIYLWRQKYDFRIATIEDDGIALLAKDNTGEPYCLPPIGVSDVVRSIHTLFDMLSERSSDPRICRVPEALARNLEAEGFKVDLDRDNSDYVYLSDDLINLAGRKYHRKRNHIKQFATQHKYEYFRVTPELVPGCMALQKMWCDVRDCFIPENTSLAEEHVAVMEALQLLEPLEIIGGAILMDGEVAAFSLGGRLNTETVVIHFEKANPACPGLYQVVNQAFCADVASEYRYVNREQDLGEPGLRKSKESYYPDHMINKYVVRPR